MTLWNSSIEMSLVATCCHFCVGRHHGSHWKNIKTKLWRKLLCLENLFEFIWNLKSSFEIWNFCHNRKRSFLFSCLIDFVNMLVRNTYPVQFPLIEPSAAISKASSPWAHRHVFSYNRCFLWLWSHNGALKQRFHEVGLLRINIVPALYVQCTVWSINVGVAGNPPGWVSGGF